MQLIIKNEITIQNASSAEKNVIKDWLTIANPQYLQNEKMGFSNYKTPRNLYFYKELGNNLVVPTGLLNKLLSNFNCDMDDKRVTSLKSEYDSKIELYDYQQEVVDTCVNIDRVSDIRWQFLSGIIVMSAGSGKGLLMDAKIYTPTGFKFNKELKIGDEIIGSNGKKCKVTGVFDRGLINSYKIIFSDGVEIICDEDHLWNVQTDDMRYSTNNWYTKDTKTLYEEILNQKSVRAKYSIPIVKPVEFQEKEVQIEPWLLGFLLADGYFGKKTISFSNSESDLIENVRKIIGGEKVIQKSKYDFCITDGSALRKQLSELNLGDKKSYDKFIPEIYKYNSIENRLAVLQGLMDGDGSVNGGFSITSTSRQLIDDCLEIIQSLGGTGKTSERQTSFSYKGIKKQGRISYRLHFKLYEFMPFTSEKHSANYKARNKYIKPYRKIKEIIPVGKKEIRCISVDSDDKLFVTDSFVVTHNTQTALELIHQLGLRTLWLTHTQDLLNQSYQRAKDNLNCGLGKISAGKIQIGEHITFATVQTMSKLDLVEYADMFDVVIVDECHRVVGTPIATGMFYKVLSSLSAKYKLGLTATPYRAAKGTELAMFSLLGDIIIEVDKSVVKTVKAKIKRINYDYELGENSFNSDGTINFSGMLTELGQDAERNEMIVQLLKENADKNILVLSDRLEQLMQIRDKLGYGVMIHGKMTSKSGKAEREKAIENMRQGKEKVLFASYSLAKEGLDIPRLDCLVLATPKKDKATIIQSVGRVERIFEGKKEPVVYDIVDSERLMTSMFNTRRAIYKKNGNELV